MRYKLLSDLHLEFYRGATLWQPPETAEDKDTTLLLAGDIHTGRRAKDWLGDMCKRFHHVVYILGNHEFYNYEINHIRKCWKEIEIADNFTFLDNDTLILGEDRIIGGTLWTEVTDPFTIYEGRKRMTDYHLTLVNDNGNRRNMIVPDTNIMHGETIQHILNELEKDWEGKTIIMTHHLPHDICVAERFKNDMLTAFFKTDLNHIIEKHDIDYWLHGHTHDNVDATIHGTRILCNPRGYPGVAINRDFIEDLTFET